jgi:hypothetical protein
MMAFEVGPTISARSGRYRFSIRNPAEGPTTFLEFAKEGDARQAEAAVRDAARNAVAVTTEQNFPSF